MPSIAHLLLGALVGLSLYYISDGKFTKTHIFVFFMNNYYGPDAGYICGLGHYTHSIVGYIFFAFILAGLYHYFTKFTIKVDRIKNIEIIELDHFKLSYLQTYFLVLAGGIMHIYLDGILNSAGVLMLIPSFGVYEGLYPRLEDLVIFWKEGALNISPVFALFIGVIFIFGFEIVLIWFLTTISTKKLNKRVFILILYIIAFLIFFYLAGNISTAVHPDAGAIFYVSLYWGAPLILCVLSTKNFQVLKKRKDVKKHIGEKAEKSTILIILHSVLLIIGIIAIIEGILLLAFSNNLIEYLIEAEFFKASHTTLAFQAFTIISIILIVIGILEILSWLYLKKEKKKHSKNLLTMSIYSFIIGSILLSTSLILFILNEVIVNYLFSNYGEIISPYFSYNELIMFALINGVIFLPLAIFMFISAFGLIMKNKKVWKFTIYYYLALSWTLLGLAAACFLSENSVKESLKDRN